MQNFEENALPKIHIHAILHEEDCELFVRMSESETMTSAIMSTYIMLCNKKTQS